VLDKTIPGRRGCARAGAGGTGKPAADAGRAACLFVASASRRQAARRGRTSAPGSRIDDEADVPAAAGALILAPPLVEAVALRHLAAEMS